MISCISGLPGSGKNVDTTHIALKHFRHENSLLKRFKRRLNHEPIYINNVYSNYPILLNKKYNIYSRITNIDDMDGSFQYLENAIIIIDEIQAHYDSDEHKEFPKEIAVFNQFHRHFGIKDIYYISQHPSRIVKKLRNIACVFTKIQSFRVIPLLNLGIMYTTNYYEFEDYGKWHPPIKEMKTYDVDNHLKFFNAKKVFNSYDSTYLRALIEDKPLLNHGTYHSLLLSKRELNVMFKNISLSK